SQESEGRAGECKQNISHPTSEFWLLPSMFLIFNLKSVVLDHGVGEQFIAHLPEPSLRRFAGRGVQFDFEIFPHAHVADLLVAQRMQRPLDRLSLWIEHSVLEGNKNFSAHNRSMKDPLEDRVDVFEVMLYIQRVLDIRGREVAPDLRIAQELALELAAFSPDLQCMTLDHAVGLVPSNAFFHQFQENPLGEDRAAALSHVAEHVIRIDDKVAEDVGHSAQHEIE